MNRRTTYWSQKRRLRLALALLVVLSVGVGCLLMNSSLRLTSLNQGSEAIRQTILSSAHQCYAIEGVYPSDIEYLEENYGLLINREDYLITYQEPSGNTALEVAVTVR